MAACSVGGVKRAASSRTRSIPVRSAAVLRVEISQPLFAHARVREEELARLADDLAATKQMHRRNPKSFLVNLGGERHRSGARPADVCVMRPVRHVRERPAIAAQVHRGYQRDVGQVRAAGVRIVENDDVTVGHRRRVDRRSDGERRRPEVHRNVRRVRHHSAGSSKTAHEKSRRSLMFGEKPAWRRTAPISSDTDASR
jgi:hypothetical protein